MLSRGVFFPGLREYSISAGLRSFGMGTGHRRRVYSANDGVMVFMRGMMIATLCFLLLAVNLHGQNAQGIITGKVTNDEGAPIVGATIAAQNIESGMQFTAVTISGGHFAVTSLPPGFYRLTISAGFHKPYVFESIKVEIAQALRINVALERLEVTEPSEEREGPDVFQGNGGQWNHSATGETIRSMPLMGFPSGQSGEGAIRNPLYALLLAPGSLMVESKYFRINGAPANSASIRVEGMDTSNGLYLSSPLQNQISVEAIEETAIQGSGYTAEFGQTGGGIINIAMRTGGNAYHGSAYEYWANEVLNASQPYLNVKQRNRRNNYGATLSGPIRLPGLYDGHKRTFFLLNFEQFRQVNIYNNQAFTVPILAYREGDFRKALTGRKLGTDPLGRSIMEGTIYDPQTERTVYGKRVRDPFPNNRIPRSRFDPVALKIQDLIPLPTNSNLVDNYVVPWRSPQRHHIGSAKIDQNSGRTRFSFYYSFNKTFASQSLNQGGDGITTPVTSGKLTRSDAHTFRFTVDHVPSPVLSLQFGFGYQGMRWSDTAENRNFNQETELGLRGAGLSIFPYITGLSAAMGGMKDMGPGVQGISRMRKPSVNAGLTRIRKNHTYKMGVEWRGERYPTTVEYPAYGFYNFSRAQTALPATVGQNLKGGTIGFPYASFLLGLVNRGDIGVVADLHLRKNAWAFYVQDSWKLAPYLTIEYGLRYDYQTYLKETEGRVANFSPTTLNPAAGNLPGAIIFEGSGEGRCNCNFADIYPFAFGPRLGIAYRMTTHTIIRAGAGIIYGQTAGENRASLAFGSTNPFQSMVYGEAPIRLKDGPPASAPWPNFNPGQLINGTVTAIDRNAGRPPRQIQFHAIVQRDLADNLTLEVSFVGSRGIWWETNGFVNINALTPQRLQTFGIDIEKSDDRNLLISPLNSSLAKQRGFSKPPYSGFSLNQTVAQSLRPFPQFGDIISRWAPSGRTWYESAQIKLTRRYSRVLNFSAGFTYQREWAIGDENLGGASLEIAPSTYYSSSIRHISALSRPYIGYIAPEITFPNWMGKKIVSSVFRNWKITAFFQYASGLPIHVPMANSDLYSLLFQNTYANRNSGQKFFTKDLNNNTLDPMKEFALNPEAWKDPPAGQFSTSPAYYKDYRFQRRPLEQVSLGRTFRINENVKLSIRADFQNIFNRIQMADPVYDNAGATQVYGTVGGKGTKIPQSGFGFVDYKRVGANPRNGMIVLRLLF